MATLYITEFTSSSADQGRAMQAPFTPAILTQTVSIGTVTQSLAFHANTRLVRLHNDAICSVVFGTDPTATTADMRLALNSTEYFGVQPGGGMKLSVIVNT